MTPALREAMAYHDPAAQGFAALLIEGRQRSYRLSELPAVLDALPRDSSVFLSQAEFFAPNRRLVNLSRLRLCFADLETFKTPYGEAKPDQQAQSLVLYCEEAGLPRPSLVNFSGRGLHAKWFLDAPIPGQALPRWNRVQMALNDALTPFSADKGARDASRCLRVVGSVNPRSGEVCRTVWTDESNGLITRWDFEEMCREVLPIERQALANRRKPEQVRKVSTTRVSNGWDRKTLWWNRLADLRLLIQIRDWQDGVPIGYRNNFLYVATCAVAWSVDPDDLPGEVKTLAAELCPSLSPSAIRSTTTTAIAKAKAGKPYKFSNRRLIELLDIGPDEQRQLRTICDADERERRDRLRHRKYTDRATYEGNAQAKREQVRQLRGDGHSYASIAAIMGLTTKQVDNLLNR